MKYVKWVISPLSKGQSTAETRSRLRWERGVQIVSLVLSALATLAAIAAAFYAEHVWRVTQDQLKVAREETAYLHRPHFRVRFATVESIGRKLFRENDNLLIRLDVLNNGQSAAHVLDSHLEIFWGKSGLPGEFPLFGPPIRNQFACEGRGPECIIQAGGGYIGTKVHSYRLVGHEAADLAVGTNGWELYLLGWIGYRRPDETYPRFFDFALKYDPEKSLFLPVKDVPDYAYDPDGK